MWKSVEKEYVMELIRLLDNKWSFGQLNHEKLVDLFVHYNDKLYKRCHYGCVQPPLL